MWNLLKESKSFWIVLGTSFLALGIAVLIYLNLKKKSQETQESEIPDSETTSQSSETNNKISDHELYAAAINALERHGFSDSYAKLMVAQAHHETGNFKSSVFARDNNLFGMNHPVVRSTTSKGADKSGYAIYDNWQDSVEDLVLWYKAKAMPEEGFEDVRGYVSEIKKKGYFTDSLTNYYAAVQKFYSQLKVNS